MDFFEKLNQYHIDAINHIKTFLDPATCPEMVGLVRWMMETDQHPYGWIPEKSGEFESAQQFLGLLRLIHHAIYDDGVIAFVKYNHEPMIMFNDKYDIAAMAAKGAMFQSSSKIGNIVVMDITNS